MFETNSSYDFSYISSERRITQKELLTDQNACYTFLDYAVNDPKDDNVYGYGSLSVYTKVVLKGGRTYYRRYYIDREDYEVLRPFIESDAYRETNYKLSSGSMGYPNKVNLYISDAQMSIDIPKSDIKRLIDAYTKDFTEHYTLEELSSYMYAVTMEMDFDTLSGQTYYFSQRIPTNYTRTLSVLHELYPTYIPYTVSLLQMDGKNVF